VVDFGRLAGAVVPNSAKLCAALTIVVTKILCLTAKSQALDIISQRLAVNDDSQSFVDALLEIDEAAEVMDKQDLEHLTTEQKAAQASKAQAQDFSSDFVNSRQRLAAAQPRVMAPRQTPLPERIEQHEARIYVPPGASIWRGITGRETWNGHMPPRKRIFMSLAEMGDRGAMLDVLKRLWKQYMELNGLTPECCPWKDLV